MIDRDKLTRIQDQLADLRAPIEAQFARYRSRVEAAERRRKDAVARARAYSHLTLAELLAFPADALEAAELDMQALRAAEREMRMAAETKDAYDRLRAECVGFSALVANLEIYAGIRS